MESLLKILRHGIKRELLPPELREVFFIDGDRALSFIEAAVNAKTKRKHVQEAIQSLLGLGVIEAAIGTLASIQTPSLTRI